MEFKVKALGYWGAGQCRADLECESPEDFKKLPNGLIIDHHIYSKISYSIPNKTAYYSRPVQVTVIDHNVAGKFEQGDIVDGKIVRTTIEVK